MPKKNKEDGGMSPFLGMNAVLLQNADYRNAKNIFLYKEEFPCIHT